MFTKKHFIFLGIAVAFLTVLLGFGLLLNSSPVHAEDGSSEGVTTDVDTGTGVDTGTDVGTDASIDTGAGVDTGADVDTAIDTGSPDGSVDNPDASLDSPDGATAAVDETAAVDDSAPADESTVDETSTVTDTAAPDDTAPADTVATIWTDKADYFPWETPIISGSGFEPELEATVTIVAPSSTVYEAVTDIDDSGGFSLVFVPSTGLEFGLYLVTATDSYNSAETTFTDAANKQYGWANVTNEWTDKPLDNTYISYAEGDVIPWYMDYPNATVGPGNTITIIYDHLDGTHYGIDVLADFDTTVVPDTTIFPATYHEMGAFRLYNGTIASISAPAPYSGTQYSVTVTFTATNTRVYLLCGLHLASELDYGTGNGASNWPGKSLRIDTNPNSGETQIDPGAIIPPGSITIVKDAVPNDPQDFSFSGTSPIGAFTLDDDADATLPNSQTFSGLTAGTYVITETVPSGWFLTNITGADIFNLAAGTATINLEAGESVIVTFTDTKGAKITVDKVTNPADAQSFDFAMSGDASASFSLTNASTPWDSGWLLPGNYTVTETVPGGWFLTNITGGTPDIPNKHTHIALTAGQTVNAVFTDTKGGTITVIKNTIGGDGTFDFTGTGGDGLPAAFQIITSGGIGIVSYYGVDPSLTYGIFETVPAGWILTSSSSSNGTPDSFTVAPGDITTVTFNNELIPPPPPAPITYNILIECPETLTIDWFTIHGEFPVTVDGRCCVEIVMTSTDGLATITIPVYTQVLDVDGLPLYLHPDFDMVATWGTTPPAPAGTIIIAVYELTPSGVTFDKPVKIVATYDPAKVPAGSVVVIAYYDEAAGKWVELETSGYVVGGEIVPNTVTANFTHTTYFALLAKVPAK